MRDTLLMIAALAASMALALLFPGIGSAGEDIATVRNISTLLFGILAGFFIYFLLSSFAAIRSVLTREGSMLMELYKLSQAIGPEFAARAAERIDRYLIVRFDEENYFNFTSRGRDALFSIFEELITVDIGNNQNLTTMHRHFVTTLREAISLRRETIVTGTITVTIVQWASLLMLAMILIATLFAMKSDTLFSSILTGMLTFAILLILYMVKSMSDLKLGGDFLKFETIERVFEFIGKPRYYPVSYVRLDLLPKHLTEIRLGIGRDRQYSTEIIAVSLDEALARAQEARAAS